jgi:hypothetical protein
LSPIVATMEKCGRVMVMLHSGDQTDVRTGCMEGSYFELGHGQLRAFTVGKHPQIIMYHSSIVCTCANFSSKCVRQKCSLYFTRTDKTLRSSSTTPPSPTNTHTHSISLRVLRKHKAMASSLQASRKRSVYSATRNLISYV